MTTDCKGCSATVRLAPGEVERLLADHLRTHPTAERTPRLELERRLALCATCPDLQYRTTCRHCGCLVEIRASLTHKHCPAPAPMW